MPSNNPVSFRLPTKLPADVHPDVAETIGLHDDAINDLQQAIPSLKAQITALQNGNTGTATAASTTAVTSSTVVETQAPNVIGAVNNQVGVTSYTTQQSDYGGFVILGNAAPIAVTLATAPGIQLPWYAWLLNTLAGTATLTPASGLINGAASFALTQGLAAELAFDGTNFTAIPIAPAPQTIAAVTGKYLTAYSSATGLFAQSATAGVSGTITIPKLTTANGSITVVNGIITAFVQPT